MCAASASFAAFSISINLSPPIEGTTIKRLSLTKLNFVGPDKLIAILDWAISDYQFDRHPIDRNLESPCFRNLKINQRGLLH
jgi:hypothetical protein